MSSIEKKRIWFLITSGSPPLDVAGPYDAFRHANRLTDNQSYELVTVSAADRIIQSSCGLNMVADYTLEEATVHGLPHTVVVCGCSVPVVPDSDETAFACWLAEHSDRVKRICSVCSGAFVLEEAGLLDGRSATTHWQLLENLKSKMAEGKVFDDTLFVKDNNVWTSAGVLAGIDIALTMVEEDLGFEISQRIAQFLVMFLRRSGRQGQFSSLLAQQATERNDPRELATYIAANLGADLSLEQLAKKACMSERNLARVFKQEFKQSIGKYVRQQRLEEACRLVETVDLSISQIAVRVGLGDESTLRRWFVAEFGISPKQFRERCRV